MAEALDAIEVDVLVDYTHASVVGTNVRAAIERGVGVVVGSSGLTAADYEELDALARDRGVGMIAAGNFSLGAALLLRFAVEAARHLDTWEVIEYQQIPLLYLPLYNPDRDSIRNAFAQASSFSPLTSVGTCSGTRAGHHVGHGFRTSAASR